MDQIEKAVDILKNGGIVIYPTDTAFGIGCRIDDENAISRLFTLRARPTNNPTPVLFNSTAMVEEYVTAIPHEVEQLLTRFWPGALTVVLNAKVEKVPQLVRGGGTTLGCRIPDHEIPLRLIEEVGIPLIGTSANFAGKPTPYSFADIDKDLVNLVDLVIKGETSVYKESTVIDCTQSPWRILRQGAIEIK